MADVQPDLDIGKKNLHMQFRENLACYLADKVNGRTERRTDGGEFNSPPSSLREGRGLHKTDRPPSCDQTGPVNPLVHAQVQTYKRRQPPTCWVTKTPIKGMIRNCCVPEGRGLHQTARPPSRDETRSVNPLVREQVDYFTTCLRATKIKKTAPTLDLF